MVQYYTRIRLGMVEEWKEDRERKMEKGYFPVSVVPNITQSAWPSKSNIWIFIMYFEPKGESIKSLTS